MLQLTITRNNHDFKLGTILAHTNRFQLSFFLKELCQWTVRFLGQNCLKYELNTFVVHGMLIEHKEEEINSK